MTVLSNLLDRSSRLADDSKSRTLQDIQDTIQAIRIVDASKGQVPAGAAGSAATASQASANWIEEYFERKFAEMQSRVETYRRMVEVCTRPCSSHNSSSTWVRLLTLIRVRGFAASLESTGASRSGPDQSDRSYHRITTYLCPLACGTDCCVAYGCQRDQAAVPDTAQGPPWDLERPVSG
jgi:hypothetical protein